MNQVSVLTLVICSIIAGAHGGQDEGRDLVFADKLPLEPTHTLQALKRLSDAYGAQNCPDCDRKGREARELIALFEVTHDTCTQKSVDHLTDLLKVYGEYRLDLVPYLNHCLKHLLDTCRDEFKVSNLSTKPNESLDMNESEIETDEYESSSESDDEDEYSTDNQSDNDGETLMERIKREREEPLSEEQIQLQEKQRVINEDWLKRFRDLFEGDDFKTVQKFEQALFELHNDFGNTFRIPADIERRLDNIVSLYYLDLLECDRRHLDTLDKLKKEYEQAKASPSLKNYIDYYQDVYLRRCKDVFQAARDQF